MKILFVTTEEYPVFGATSNLINRIAFDGGLVDDNLIDVLSLTNEYTQQLHEVYKGINIFRVVSYGKIGLKKYKELFQELNVFQKIMSFIEKVYFTIHEKGGQHPGLYCWINSYRLACAMNHLDQKGYDVVIPISGSYDAVAAVLMSKIKAKKVFWQVDPCADNWLRKKAEVKKGIKLERKIAKSFDAIFTDELYYRSLISHIQGLYRKKVHVIKMPLLLIRNEKQKKNKGFVGSENRVDCVFCGLIYAGIRDPQYTYRVFDCLGNDNNITLHMYGVDDDGTVQCSKSLVFHGRVQMDEAARVVYNADILVNIGNIMTNQIPSKVFEYIATGKPIINICKNKNCPTIHLLEKYPNSLSIIEDDSQFDEQIKKVKSFIYNNKGKILGGAEIRKNYHEYTPEECAKVIKELLNQVIES